MDSRRAVVSLGVAVTAFVVAGVVATELASSAIEFSVFVGIPVGLVAAVLAALAVEARLRAGLDRPRLALVAGVAATGYGLVGLLLARYAVAPVRSLLTLQVIVGGSLLVGVVVALASWFGGSERPPA